MVGLGFDLYYILVSGVGIAYWLYVIFWNALVVCGAVCHCILVIGQCGPIVVGHGFDLYAILVSGVCLLVIM